MYKFRAKKKEDFWFLLNSSFLRGPLGDIPTQVFDTHGSLSSTQIHRPFGDHASGVHTGNVGDFRPPAGPQLLCLVRVLDFHRTETRIESLLCAKRGGKGGSRMSMAHVKDRSPMVFISFISMYGASTRIRHTHMQFFVQISWAYHAHTYMFSNISRPSNSVPTGTGFIINPASRAFPRVKPFRGGTRSSSTEELATIYPNRFSCTRTRSDCRCDGDCKFSSTHPHIHSFTRTSLLKTHF